MVVSNIFYFHPWGNDHLIWEAYFSDGWWKTTNQALSDVVCFFPSCLKASRFTFMGMGRKKWRGSWHGTLGGEAQTENWRIARKSRKRPLKGTWELNIRLMATRNLAWKPVEVCSWSPVIYRGLGYIPGGAGFFPSTVSRSFSRLVQYLLVSL